MEYTAPAAGTQHSDSSVLEQDEQKTTSGGRSPKQRAYGGPIASSAPAW